MVGSAFFSGNRSVVTLAVGGDGINDAGGTAQADKSAPPAMAEALSKR